MIITAPGVSKKHAAVEIAESINVPLRSILGIGDNLADWQFMELCGYTAAMGNATDDLKELVSARGDKGYVGKSIDKNGILDILNHYAL